jgi:hypothetical protein
MKFNKWTMGLAAVGVVSLASAARADETKMERVQTALSNTTLSGYVDTSAQWNLGNQNGGATPGYSYGAGKADGFNLNAVDITLDKPMDESPWAAGYHVELMDGPDSVLPPGLGNFASIRQAYLALRTPVGNSGIDWKIGVWDTIIGYESSTSYLNPNYTRSYGYSIEPTSHTGILATYKINDMVTIQAGVADGSNANGLQAGFNGRVAQESQKAYMGAIAFTAPDSAGFMKGATLNMGIIQADSTGRGVGFPNNGSTSLYAGVTVPTPLTALKVGAAFDYVDFHKDNAAAPGHSDPSASAFALYANYQVNDKLSFNGRGELLEDNNAGFTAGPGVYELTFTTDYKLWENVLSRVELRWDHSQIAKAYDNTSTGVVGAHQNAYMLALNLIYQF